MLNPTILWAQDKKSIFLTFEIRNIKEQDIQFFERNLKIKGKNENNEFDVNIELYSDINVENSTWSIKPKGIICTLKKNLETFWNKLSTIKMNNLKIDWSKWVNEDDSDLEDNYPFDKNEMLSGFENFKKELPQNVLEKDFSELIPDLDNLDISDNDETGYDASNEMSTSDNNNNLNSHTDNINILEVNKNAKLDNIIELNDDNINHIDNIDNIDDNNDFDFNT